MVFSMYYMGTYLDCKIFQLKQYAFPFSVQTFDSHHRILFSKGMHRRTFVRLPYNHQ